MAPCANADAWSMIPDGGGVRPCLLQQPEGDVASIRPTKHRLHGAVERPGLHGGAHGGDEDEGVARATSMIVPLTHADRSRLWADAASVALTETQGRVLGAPVLNAGVAGYGGSTVCGRVP